MKRFWNFLDRFAFTGSALVLIIFVTSSCNLPLTASSQTKTPELVFPTIIPSPAPLVVTATTNPLSLTSTSAPAAAANTSTSIPPTVPPPPAVLPTAALAASSIHPSPVRINFATGATSGIVVNTIQAGEVQNYLVGAEQTQPLLVSTDSLNNDVTFSVQGMSDGKTLLHQSDKTSSWQTMLEVSQDYLIQVYGGASTEKYNLNISTPARVIFDPGAISATRKGSTPGGYNVAYVLRANANQQMDLSLVAPPGTAVLSVYGYQDGNPYLRYVVEQTSFSLKLPATQDYIIQVVPRAGQITNYTITFTIK